MKPKFQIKVSSLDNKTSVLNALFDTGSFYTIIRKDKLPGTQFFVAPQTFRTAAHGGKLHIDGQTILRMEHEGKTIEDDVLISSDLVGEMIVGAKTMQCWDVTIHNTSGHTQVIFGKDIHDPDITEVD